MISLHHPSQIPDLQPLLELRYQQLGSLDDMILVEPGDTMPELETALGLSFQLWEDDPDSVAFEILEDHGHCYEMVFITNDDEAATVIIIPKQAGIDADLLNLCQTHAVPSL